MKADPKRVDKDGTQIVNVENWEELMLKRSPHLLAKLQRK